MHFSDADPDAIRQVALNMRERDFAEFSAVNYFGEDRKELAEGLANHYADREDVTVIWHRAAPVAVAGTISLRPNSVALLFFATPAVSEIGLPLTRSVRETLATLERHGVHRMECVTLAGYGEMQRWLRLLGFEQEGVCRAFGRNGEDFLQFSRINHARQTGASEGRSGHPRTGRDAGARDAPASHFQS